MARFEAKKGKVYDACNGEAMSAEHVAAYMNMADEGTGDLLERCARLERERDEARANLAEASRLWDGPETADWLDGVRKEAAHQVARWGLSHDAGKDPEEFFWLLGYLGGKALHALRLGDIEKAKHHTISTGAALLNWHARITGLATQFRPGMEHDDAE